VHAVTVALAAAPRIDPLVPAMRELAGFELEHARSLRTYAMAAWYADAVATAPDDGRFAALLDEGIPLRRSMLVAADALADRGLLSADRVAEIRAGSGHHDTAQDLVALAELFGAHWKAIERKTAITRDEVDRAETLGAELLRALVERRDNTGSPELHQQRARAFTLFARAYDQCRRALAYLRWEHGDADEIAPSIYARRRKRSATEPTEEPDPPTVLEPPAPEPAPRTPDMPELPLMD
jgi:hypothetical protein